VTEQFTFFYGGIGSQWHPSKFVIDNVEYNCGEQYMMSEKARLFGDEDALEIIMGSKNPKIQKAAGRLVKNFDNKVWEANRKAIVYRGNYAKFTQNPSMLEWLLSSHGSTLVEASPWDKIWGIGLTASDPRAQNRATWQGSNDLGKIETQLREDLIALSTMT